MKKRRNKEELVNQKDARSRIESILTKHPELKNKYENDTRNPVLILYYLDQEVVSLITKQKIAEDVEYNKANRELKQIMRDYPSSIDYIRSLKDTSDIKRVLKRVKNQIDSWKTKNTTNKDLEYSEKERK